MDDANTKTDIKKIIIAELILNLCIGSYDICQENKILLNQQEIIENEKSIMSELSKAKIFLLKFENIYNSIEAREKMIKVSVFKNVDIPDFDTSFKAYMDYRKITNKASDQYKLQQYAWTDNKGLRRYKNYYLVAMGTYYSKNIGDIFKITLENGNTFFVMVGDIKADKDTDEKNMYSAVCSRRGKMLSANVLEFIVDDSVISKRVKFLGTVSAYDEFQGNIQKIEKKETMDLLD